MFFGLPAIAQISISGKVLDDHTGLPLPGASIYFNNSTIGTYADKDGKFTLSAAQTLTELVVTMIGYDVMVHNTSREEAVNRIVFRLMPKQTDLEDILIVSDETRRKWLQLFSENFLGLTEEAAQTSISNAANIYFIKGEDDYLRARSDSPLLLINKMLGYKLYFTLVEFGFSEKKHSSYFTGFTRYEELGDPEKYRKKRLNAYYGSTMHFYRSLLHNQLEQEKYFLFIKELDSSVSAKKPRTNFRPVTASAIVRPDSINKDLFKLQWQGKLAVEYRKEPSSKRFLQGKYIIEGDAPQGFIAYLDLTVPYMFLNSQGTISDPLHMMYNGYWIYEKAANFLPYDYEPQAKK
ncbi:MAG: hypothetical protein JWQ27_3073 [Ferruginibacter sp.]|nr:hypothetical protein [Ferruginibacter sp.]